MSKKLSFRGQIPMGVQERIKLRTMNGKTGYQITKFQIINKNPVGTTAQHVCKIYAKDQTGSITDTVDFTETDLLACAALKTSSAVHYSTDTIVVFDNNVFNQDIFIYFQDTDGNTDPGNYYIEIETIELSDLQATQLTLKSLRQVASR